MFFQNTETITDAIVKASPVAAASGLTFMGCTLPEVVQILSGIYAFLLAVDKIYMMFLRYRESRNKDLHAIKDGSEST